MSPARWEKLEPRREGKDLEGSGGHNLEYFKAEQNIGSKITKI